MTRENLHKLVKVKYLFFCVGVGDLTILSVFKLNMLGFLEIKCLTKVFRNGYNFVRRCCFFTQV